MSARTRHRGLRLRILILEDDPFIGFDLQAIVEKQGHEIVGVFSSLAEAREHLADGFDFALLDIDVSDGKSFEIAKALLDRGVPFAFVSATGPNELPSHLRGARFVPKPFEEATIVRTIPHEPAELL
jgi:DNA-binding response OmpR family regulator